MKKLFIILILFSLLISFAQAQDIIHLLNRDRIEAIITEITATEVRYRRADQPTGPIRTIPVSEVNRIVYAGGSEELLNEIPIIPPRVGGIVSFGEYQWRILEIQGDRALILSESNVDRRQMHDLERGNLTFRNSQLFQWLNTEFYDMFSDNDKSRIIDNRGVKVFLLSGSEVRDYLSTEANRNANRDVDRVRDINGTNLGSFWISWPASTNRGSRIDSNGQSFSAGAWTEIHGVRPAMWVSL